MYRRICFYGGPGAGKSLEAASAFVSLKKQHRKAELVQEYIKNWAYEKRLPKSFAQVYIFGKQLYAEDLVLSNGVDLVVTDSPVFLGTCYAKKFQTPGWKQLVELSDIFDQHFPPLHIYLERGNKPYQTAGRYQKYEEALEMDRFVLQQLEETGKTYHRFETLTLEDIIKLLGEHKVSEGAILPPPLPPAPPEMRPTHTIREMAGGFKLCHKIWNWVMDRLSHKVA